MSRCLGSWVGGQAQPIPRFESFSCGGLGMCVSHGFPREATSDISHPSQDGAAYFMELPSVAGQSLVSRGQWPVLLGAGRPCFGTWSACLCPCGSTRLHLANGGPALVFRVPSLEPQLALYLDSRRQGRAPSTPLGVPQSRMPTTMGLRSLPSVGRPAASCSQTCLS